MTRATERAPIWPGSVPGGTPLFIAVLILAAVGLYGYRRFVAYVDTDPAFCGSCHISRGEYALWTRSEHRTIYCQECHHETQEEALRTLVLYVTGQADPDGNRAHKPAVVDETCGGCHLSHDGAWPRIGNSVGHKVHLAAPGVGCQDCHARSIHSFRATAEACLDCHGDRSLRVSQMEDLHCLACHNFMTTDETIKPDRNVCLACHASMGVEHSELPKNAAMATMPCWSCHQPHAEDVALVACDSCHETSASAGAHRVHVGTMGCTTCHKAHTWAPERSTCTACHSDRVEHNPSQDCASCHDFRTLEAP